jgi:hypothetical protein
MWAVLGANGPKLPLVRSKFLLAVFPEADVGTTDRYAGDFDLSLRPVEAAISAGRSILSAQT